MATTPTLRGPQGQLASSIDEKETLIRSPEGSRNQLIELSGSPALVGVGQPQNQAIKRSVTGIQSLSFTDDIVLLASGYSVKEVCDRLQEAARVAIEWGHGNVVQFDAGKTEAVLLTRKRGQELKDQIQ
ncbi:hypothetical protein SI65_09662 [Aspergillus cristatus]|uniref:Reverse transcriptase domain-containing protein n=1 Tax=Aspergillus cristatus TaxID=573508 RepID=A0A1E3B1S9_ASPCR|nr:hypothetical protein SI65_09662 [Aspergillus cristatus]